MKQQKDVCKHKWSSLGFQKVSTDETKVEVIAAIFCKNCGMFRTKMLYFDRQRESNKSIS